MIPNILSIAGSDPSGGAGVQADLKAISANGGYAMAAVTVLTVQNTQGVYGVQPVDADFVARQIEAVFDDIEVHAVKIGMILSAEIGAAVSEVLAKRRARNIVLDPVMVAKGGDRLLAEDAVTCLRTRLAPLCRVITPNLPEAAVLADLPAAVDRSEMPGLATKLSALGPEAVLLKGGHLPGPESPDYLLGPDTGTWFEGRRVATRNTHGTGCTLSSALAAQLPQCPDLETAVREAKAYVGQAIAGADRLDVGRGHGPTHHFAKLWGAGG